MKEASRAAAMVLVVLFALIVFGAAYLNVQRQADLLKVTCASAVEHRELAVRVLENARILNDVSRELGLPVEPVPIHIPQVPAECRR